MWLFIYCLTLQVQQFLPIKSLSCKTVGKRSALSLEAFLRDHYLSGIPVIIRDSMDHWPAKSKWNDMNYLRRVAGFRTVPVEVITFTRIVISSQLNSISNAYSNIKLISSF